jgi:hypothetical protein
MTGQKPANCGGACPVPSGSSRSFRKCTPQVPCRPLNQSSPHLNLKMASSSQDCQQLGIEHPESLSRTSSWNRKGDSRFYEVSDVKEKILMTAVSVCSSVNTGLSSLGSQIERVTSFAVRRCVASAHLATCPVS